MRSNFTDDHPQNLLGRFFTHQEAVLRPLVEEVPVDIDRVRLGQIGRNELADLVELVLRGRIVRVISKIAIDEVDVGDWHGFGE